ncbi:MAG: gamma-glutamyltransferase [Bacteroidetes bacterium HGW-Bacteroidetes-17]|jgi:gamma-glutamyltranspeptidase/glutathione hydrolase|nr:MAG: gamma-glutamyltransferase [Bacteroidetes bacterium HGW-Bacteroidetes-17]
MNSLFIKKPFLQIITINLLLIFLIPLQLRAQTYARNGMVSSSSMIASEVGRDILKQGGNAIDAAVATAFALAVTWPSAGNIGGGGFLVFMNDKAEVTTIDFREKAPINASSTMFLDQHGNIFNDSNHTGGLSIGVPGTVAGLYLAHQKYGKLRWEEVVQPAVDLANNGFPFTWTLYHHSIEFKKYYAESLPEFSKFMLEEDGSFREPGKLWKQTDLGASLERIRDHGRDGFYKGKTAKLLAEYIQEEGGIITEEDLLKYEAIERKPVVGKYRGYDIYSMPPPSSGGVTMIEMLNILEHFNLQDLGFNSADYIHVLSEAMRRGYASRAEYLGDPDFNPDMPLDKLLTKSYAKKLAASIDMKKASVSDSTKYGQLYDGENTTHLSVLDKDGNAVSLTYTLENSYGCKLIAKNLGFLLNNEMGDFNPVPGITKTDGQIGTNANQVASEKRMLSSMTPTIIAKDGKVYMVIGSPGGRTIINSVMQAILNVLDHKMDIKTAIEAGKIHHQWLPDQVIYEELGISSDTKKMLESMGHKFRSVENIGALMGIVYDRKKGIMAGAADSSSGDGGVAVY